MSNFARRARRRAVVLVAAVVAATALTGLAPMPADAAFYCGPAIAKPGGGTWTCTFADEFNGTTLSSSRWVRVTTAVNGYTNAGECYVNSTNNVSVGNGVLSLTARTEPSRFVCRSPYGNFQTQTTGGFVTSWSKFSQTYGRFEVRAKFPTQTVAGLQSALWLWPNNANRYGSTWPSSGEIDIAEYFTQYPDRAIPYVHYRDGGSDPNVTNNWCMITDPSNWHTYALEWTSTTLTISYDGATCIKDTWNPVEMTKPAPFNQPFYLNLTQALGLGTNAFSSSTPMPATTQVDYVHVWQ
jgi:beta-glucanase (GH16 family)